MLFHLRNNISINALIRYLNLPNKFREGFLRFLCPICGEFNTATNPKTNLARCFRCKKNFNPIDLVIVVRKCSFKDAVTLLKAIDDSAPSDRQIAAVSRRR